MYGFGIQKNKQDGQGQNNPKFNKANGFSTSCFNPAILTQ